MHRTAKRTSIFDAVATEQQLTCWCRHANSTSSWSSARLTILERELLQAAEFGGVVLEILDGRGPFLARANVLGPQCIQGAIVVE